MSLSSKIMQIIYEISNSPSQRISEYRVNSILSVSKAQWYKTIKSLTEDGLEGLPPILSKCSLGTRTGEALHDKTGKFICHESNYFKLNTSEWGNLFYSELEGQYYLEAFKRLGYLFDYDIQDIEIDDESKIKKKSLSDLSRKFFYLSKIQAKEFSKENKNILNKTIHALLNNKYLHLKYGDNGNKDKLRKIAPLTIVQHRDDLYLLAHACGNESTLTKNNLNLRTFKLNRVKYLEETNDNSFVYPAPINWNPEERYKRTSGLINGPVQIAELKVYGESRIVFKEKNFFNNRHLLEISTNEHDFYECSYTNINEFLGQVFIYAQDIEIIGSKNLQAEFIKKASLALSRNSESKVKKSA